MSIVTDRRCDGCGTIRPWSDDTWLAVLPPRWDAVDHRLDFCDEECLRKAARRKNFRSLIEGTETWAESNTGTEQK